VGPTPLCGGHRESQAELRIERVGSGKLVAERSCSRILLGLDLLYGVT
jgi:hypothetical protein